MSLMSKESPKLILNTLIASAAAATMIGLSGCSPQPEEPKVSANVYRTVADCMADGNASNLCSTALAEAKAEAIKSTPTYESKQDCEEDWGSSNCGAAGTTLATAEPEQELGSVDTLASTATTAAPTTTHSSGFSPFFWGYMMGSHGSSHSSYSQPVYRGMNNTPHLANGFAVSPGRTAVPASAFNKAGKAYFAAGQSKAAVAKAAGTSVSRGGFGSVGRAGGGSMGG